MTGKSARRMTITKGKRLYVRSDKIQAFLFNAQTTSALLIHFLTLQPRKRSGLSDGERFNDSTLQRFNVNPRPGGKRYAV